MLDGMLSQSFSYPTLIKTRKILVCGLIVGMGACLIVLTHGLKKEERAPSQLPHLPLLENPRLWAPPFTTPLSRLGLRQMGDEISLIGWNEEGGGAPLYLIFLEKSKQWKDVSENERTYLSFSDKGIAFSSSPTPLWFKVELEGGRPFITLHLWAPVEDEERVISDVARYPIALQSRAELKKYLEQADPIPAQALNQLKAALFWGSDQLIDLYGGDSYGDLKGKERLEFVQVTGNPILFIDKTDRLLWNGARWVKGGEDGKGKLTARYRSTSSSKVEFEVLGEKGIQRVAVLLSSGKEEPTRFKPEDIFLKSKLRTPEVISCQLGVKSTLLRVGDWLLKGEAGWKVLRRLEEIETYLSYGAKGELFVLDGIEKNNGETSLKGRLFNGMRTRADEIIYPLVQKRAKMAPLSRSSSPGQSSKLQLPVDDDDSDDLDDDDEEIGYIRLDHLKKHEAHTPY